MTIDKDLSNRRFENISTTTSVEELNEAVYGDNRLARRHALSNPMLTHEQFHYLYPLYSDSALIYFLLTNINCPADLLHKIALVDEDPVVREMVTQHRNATQETLVVVTLRSDKVYEDSRSAYEEYKTKHQAP